MTESERFDFTVENDEAGLRLDSLVAQKIGALSRSLAATLIRQGEIVVDGSLHKPGYTVKPTQRITGRIPPPVPSEAVAEDIRLGILYEDGDMLAINKPPGMVIHPAAGHSGGTIVNALLHHCPYLAGIGGVQRPGIVHRLDKDTSGVVVVAKTTTAHLELSRQFKERTIKKRYLALVFGGPESDGGIVDLPVGRDPVDRKKMSVNSPRGRTALTVWHIRERFHGATLLDVDLRTGRTHQIRVHCRAMGHPIIGDPVYGPGRRIHTLAQSDPELHHLLSAVRRQMLHAAQLEISHPIHGTNLIFKAPLPDDIRRVLEQLTKLSSKMAL